METTTIKLGRATKRNLDRFREHKDESYDAVIAKLIFIAQQSKKDPEMSHETVLAIEAARERIRKGRFVTEDDARTRLGM